VQVQCVLLESSAAAVDGAELVGGMIEVDHAVGPERGFHGVVRRMQDDES
jgi:hypothetical protein